MLKKEFSLRVVSYNVLSSSLSRFDYFTGVKEEKFCSPKYRYEGLIKKLSKETERDRKSIICLQEVSLSWTGKLHAFFNSNNYTFIVSNYGSRFNGFMGVGIAYPTDEYSLIDCQIVCLADTKPNGWSRNEKKKENESIVEKAWNVVPWLFSFWKKQITNLLSTFLPKKDEDPWSYSKSRLNSFVSVKLRKTKEKKKKKKMNPILLLLRIICHVHFGILP